MPELPHALQLGSGERKPRLCKVQLRRRGSSAPRDAALGTGGSGSETSRNQARSEESRSVFDGDYSFRGNWDCIRSAVLARYGGRGAFILRWGVYLLLIGGVARLATDGFSRSNRINELADQIRQDEQQTLCAEEAAWIDQGLCIHCRIAMKNYDVGMCCPQCNLTVVRPKSDNPEGAA